MTLRSIPPRTTQILPLPGLCFSTIVASTLGLQGILAAGFHCHGQQMVVTKDGQGCIDVESQPAFFPKAFAGNGPLPASLSAISIPIALEPKKPGSSCRRFRFQDTCQRFPFLYRSLKRWGENNLLALGRLDPYREDQFPPELSSRQQDCAEPLLHIADFIGGDWPQRARHALVNVFALAAFEDFYSSRQILSDIRDAFTEKENPAWISTADLLAFLHIMDDRTWDDWNKGKPITPKELARLLSFFGNLRGCSL
jgi:hypothetical protein